MFLLCGAYFAVTKSLLEHLNQTVCTVKGTAACLPNHGFNRAVLEKAKQYLAI
jgi:hypothetical protein